jgi:O-antigen/teichoic acid export membrane protein
MASAVLIVPILIRRMGTDSFGLLSFIWMVVGYSTFLDLGLGRALTQGVAARIGGDEENTIPAIVLAGIGLLLVMGLLGGLGLALGSGWISGRFLKVPAGLIQDAHRCLLIASLAVPLVVIGAALRGILEAYQKFREISLIRSCMGVLMYASALPILWVTREVWVVVASLVVVRVFEVVAYAFQCRRVMPSGLREQLSPRASLLKPLMSFGLWSTLNNLIGSFMSFAYADRLFLSTFVGTSALAYFGTPFDLAIRVLILPNSLVGVLFPALSNLGKESERAIHLVHQSMRLVIFGTAPVFLFLVATADPLLTLWISADFAGHSSLIFQFILMGMFMVSLTYVPFAYIQAAGRPDLSAKRHMVEIPFYIVGSLAAIHWLGVKGSSMLWFLWSVIDLVLIVRIMQRLMGHSAATEIGKEWLLLAICFAVSFAAGASGRLWLELGVAVILPLYLLFWGWRHLLYPDDRAVLVRWIPWLSRLTSPLP